MFPTESDISFLREILGFRHEKPKKHPYPLFVGYTLQVIKLPCPSLQKNNLFKERQPEKNQILKHNSPSEYLYTSLSFTTALRMFELVCHCLCYSGQKNNLIKSVHFSPRYTNVRFPRHVYTSDTQYKEYKIYLLSAYASVVSLHTVFEMYFSALHQSNQQVLTHLQMKNHS